MLYVMCACLQSIVGKYNLSQSDLEGMEMACCLAESCRL